MQPARAISEHKRTMPCHGLGLAYSGPFFFKNATCQPFIIHSAQISSARYMVCSFTGKERDGETGYGYFGARYMDHEILATFLSVDRYADKYPFISPYAYCLWNPIRLTDPTGDTVVVTGPLADNCVEQLNSEHLKIQRDAQTGVLSISFKGRYSEKDLSEHEAFLYQAINSTDCRIEVTADRTASTVDGLGNSINTFSFLGSLYSTNVGGSNMGVEYISSTNTAIAKSFVDPILLSQNGYEQGVPHELIEAYLCALKAIAKQGNIPIAYQQKGVPGTNPDIMDACNASVPPRVKNGQIYQFGPNAGKIK